MKLTLGFSSCPNDTFIFDAMVHGRIDTEGLDFEYFIADVEELNKRALAAETDITKISYHAYAYVAHDYLILDSGSALGRKNGPLLISRHDIKADEINSVKIAIPGKYTTANLLLSIAFPLATNKIEYRFSAIEEALLNEEVDAGLIIHESRFTYAKKGLRKIKDLGEHWEKLTNMPVPLGAIVIKRTVPEDIALKVNRVLRRSLEHAYEDSIASYPFVSANAQNMESNVVNNHIKLFVNEYTSSLGSGGKSAIRKLYDIAFEKGIIPELPERIFLTLEEERRDKT